jgi:HK97 family phage prohead protease
MTTIHYTRRRLLHASAPARLADLGRDAFEGYASLFGVPDGAGDVVAPGAFAASLRKRPARDVRMLYQHFAHEPIGVWDQVREDARGLYVRGRLTLDVTRAREVRALIADGALNGLSIGFRTVRARRDAASGLRTLTEVELWEISVVTFPLLSGSAVTGLGEKSDEVRRIRRAAEILRTANHLPLVGRSKNPKDFSGGGPCASLPPTRKTSRYAQSFSTSPRGGGESQFVTGTDSSCPSALAMPRDEARPA